MRNVGDERREGPRAADADQDMSDGENEDIGREARGDEADAEEERGDDQRREDAETVDQPADGDGADAEADHGERVGQRRVRPATPKSACTAGSATTKAHMPTLPMVPSSTATNSRSQA